jgi:pimeloyl-ACP methyl ester carboxylesterase
VPTVFVQDDTDVRTRPDDARRLHAAHPGSRLVLTHGLGHNRILDDPAVVETVVEHLTARVGAPTA